MLGWNAIENKDQVEGKTIIMKPRNDTEARAEGNYFIGFLILIVIGAALVNGAIDLFKWLVNNLK